MTTIIPTDPTDPTSDAAASTPAVEGRVEYVVFPLTFGLRAGPMRLADGRLRYTRKWRNRVVFDAPVAEFHSLARSSWGTGFHLWHGAQRHRFIAYHPVVAMPYGTGFVADVAEGVSQYAQARVAMARSQADVDGWYEVLAPVVAAEPPAGVRVRPPLTRRRFALAMAGFAIGATAVVVAAITAVVFTFGS